MKAKDVLLLVCLLLVSTSAEAQLFGGRWHMRINNRSAPRERHETLPLEVNGEKFDMVLVRGGT